MDWLCDPQIWASLLTLTALEIVLGIDNLVFIAILAGRLPAERQDRARRVGLALALITRLALLASIAWIIGLTQPVSAVFRHPVAAAFDLPGVPRGGDGNTVNATGGGGDYVQRYGASYREILDCADWDRSVATSVPGQSGQPGSPHYGDLLAGWAEGRYFPLVFSRARVEQETAHVLTLTPRP